MTCRACGGRCEPWLDWGLVPLANGLLKAAGDHPTVAPIRLARCLTCGTSHLMDWVEPAVLFSGAYPFRSGVSAPWRAHCGALAAALADKYPRGAGLDLGSNDGTLVKAARAYDLEMLGVDPACPEADVRGFVPDATEAMPSGRCDVITALNVLGHVPDPHPMLAECARLLTPDGTLVIEAHAVQEMLRLGEFDAIYHEHVTYWSLTGLAAALAQHGLHVTDARLIDMHGGSLHVEAMKGRAGTTAHWNEFDLFAGGTYVAFEARMRDRVRRAQAFVEGRRVAGFGASAKGTILAHHAGLGPSTLAYVVDETPEKQGKWTPYGVPIVPFDALRDDPVDAVLVFAWNFWSTVTAKLRPLDERGGLRVQAA